MSIATVITEGYGTFGSPAFVVLDGYSSSAAATTSNSAYFLVLMQFCIMAVGLTAILIAAESWP